MERFISLPVVLIIILNPNRILEIIYGGSYSLGGRILVILLIGQLMT
jgi:O-antigen/teichoic acid export membrane protein